MGFAPQHDWQAYETVTAKSDAAWLRSLSAEDKFAIYADMFNLIWAARQGQGWEQLEKWAWEEKLALRKRMVDAYRKLDERIAADNCPSDNPS